MPERPTLPRPRVPQLSPDTWANGHLPHATDCWQWELAGLRDLSRVRRELRGHLDDEDLPSEPGDEASDRMTLALDELASNGLRHGRQPVSLRVCPLPGHWLVDVMDAAVDRPPSPSPDRPAGQGGYGLFMIAACATAYGWVAEPHCKHVWAMFPRRSSPAPGTAGA